VKHGRSRHVALLQAHAHAVLEIDGGKQDHERAGRDGAKLNHHGFHFRKFAISRRPSRWLFSGWNWVAVTLSRCTAAVTRWGPCRVTVTATTVYERGLCGDLTIGKRVHVKGTMTEDGSVEATTIQVQSDSPGFPVIEGDGHVSSLVAGTSCPALKFTIEDWTVTLDSSTVFTGGSCTSVAVGKKLGVMGTVTADHQVLATRIVFKAGDAN
jgi:hypothetical protein